MSTPTDTRPDAFEAEVRAMLARRAGDVRPGDLSADLPDGLRIAVDPRASATRPGRARWVAVAAAALILLAGLGLVVRGVGDGDGGGAGPADSGPSTVTAPPREPMFDRLPAGVDPTAGDPLFTAPPLHHDPASAMAEALDPAFGEELSPPMPFRVEEDEVGRWWSHYVPLGALDPAAWGAEDPNEAGTGGWVLVRRDPSGPDAGWGVVAVDSSAIDLSDVRRDGTHLAGAVRLTSSAPIRVEVSRPDGEVLATSDLTTHEASGHAVSVLAVNEIEVGTGPVVLRVEAGDRPGQVGLDGVGVAALSEVVLPAEGDVEESSGPPTTQAPSASEPGGPGATTTRPAGGAPAGEVLWRPSGALDDVFVPVAMAAMFVEEALGEEPEGASGPGTGPGDTAASVVVRLASGAEVEVDLVRDDDGWGVSRVGGGGVELDRSGGGTSLSGVTVGSSEKRTRLVALRRGPSGWTVDAATLPDLPDLDGATGIIVVALDEQGRVIAAQGNPT